MKISKQILILLTLVTMSSCTKELLDFESETYFDVQTFLASKNCESECNTIATCEGEVVKLRAVIDTENIIKESGFFRIKDVNDNDYSMQVNVEENILEKVFNKVSNLHTKTIKIEGKIEGFDAPTNISCERRFTLRIEDATNISPE